MAEASHGCQIESIRTSRPIEDGARRLEPLQRRVVAPPRNVPEIDDGVSSVTGPDAKPGFGRDQASSAVQVEPGVG
ncbi:hypothetical protein ABTN25_20015, partial [Acinetobacter baumannii]